VTTTAVNGLPAVVGAFAASTQQGAVEGVTLFVDHRGAVYQVIGYGAAERFAGHINVLSSSLGSFANETDQRVLGAKPWRVKIVKPDRALTPAEFLRFYPGPVPAEELARINQIEPGQLFPAGVPAKRIIGEARAF